MAHLPSSNDQVKSNYSHDEQSNTIYLRLSMSRLPTHIYNFLQQRYNLSNKTIFIEFHGTPDWHKTPPPTHLAPLLFLDTANALKDLSLQKLPGLVDDLQTYNNPESLIAIIFLIFAHYASGPIHLCFTSSTYLHNIPLFTPLFSSPKPSPRTGLKTWSPPPAWQKPYWPPLLKLLAPQIHTLEMHMTWSMASTISYPPFNTMIPISHFPGLSALRRLVVPYFAVVPRLRGGVALLPTSALPGALVEVGVVEAYPSRGLAGWVREVKVEKNRLVGLGCVEVGFDERFAARSFEAFGEGVGGGRFISWEPPVWVLEFVESGE